MEHKILKHNEEECFIELINNDFRTKIEFNFNPNENFKGLAVCCNYHYKNHPVGYLKDNNLILSKITGHKHRATFDIGDTTIQAGPTLIENYEKKRAFKEENISTKQIVSGFQVHIGMKKSGNIIIGYTEKNTLKEITLKYEEYHCQNAIKLPGRDCGSFYWKSTMQEIKKGLFPIPVALIFESRLKKVRDLND
jgi:hypothetical protein